MTSRMTRRFAALTLVTALALTGCSGEDDVPVAEPTPTESASPEPTSRYALPEGVTATPEGAELATGETATVAWEPRADLVGVLDVTVDAIGRARMKEFAGWQLDKQTRRSTPYFVISTLRNAGEDDLGGLAVPLFVGADSQVLIQASEFQAPFETCPSEPFPEEFLPGEELTICQVYLLPEGTDLANITFRPTQEFDPIQWTADPVAWGKVRKKIKNKVGSQLVAKAKAAKKAERQKKRAERRQKAREKAEQEQDEQQDSEQEPDEDEAGQDSGS